MSTCSSCGATIVWARTPKGKRMPVDPEPTPDGNVVLVATGSGYEARVVGPLTAAPVGASMHTAHFATCPDAHRRPR